MGKTDVLTGLRIGSIDNLITLKRFAAGSGSGEKYADRTATGNPVIFTTNFAQNAKALTVDFAPKQSLNGFDHPWAGGTGRNLVGDSLLTYGKSINGSGVIVDYSAYRCATMNPIIVDNTKSYVISSASSDFRAIYAVYNGSTFVRRVANVASGTVLNISGGDRVYLCFYVYDSSRASGSQYDYRKVSPTSDEIQFEQGSTPTAYERYDNICPITGFDSITAFRTEENLLGNLPTNTVTTNGVTFTTRGQAIVATKTAESESSAMRYIDIPNTVGAGNYYFFAKPIDDNYESDFYVWDNTTGSRAKKWDGTTNAPLDLGLEFGTLYELKIESGHSYTMACRVYADAKFGEHLFVPTLLRADTNASKVQIEFNGTRYGGSLNFKTGVLTITDAEIASYNGESLPSTWISDRDEYKTGTTPSIGAQVVYKLATPQTYQLTARQLALLEGANTITTDGDNINVTYQVKV